jgi:hypothetical protein
MRSLVETRPQATLSPETLPALTVVSAPESHTCVRHIAAERNDAGIVRLIDELHFDPDSLVAAVDAACSDGATVPFTVLEHRQQRPDIAGGHLRLYRYLP